MNNLEFNNEDEIKRGSSKIINCNGVDNFCSTPYYILVGYLFDCLKDYKKIHDNNRICHGLSAEEEI